MALSTSIKKSQDSSKTRFGRYTQGGEVENFNFRIGWWERTLIEESVDDIRYVISSANSGRPDLIAFQFYQRPGMAWLVMQYNSIVDPVVELTTGKVIVLPSPSRALTSITSASI
jgi:hypothetical protein